LLIVLEGKEGLMVMGAEGGSHGELGRRGDEFAVGSLIGGKNYPLPAID